MRAARCGYRSRSGFTVFESAGIGPPGRWSGVRRPEVCRLKGAKVRTYAIYTWDHEANPGHEWHEEAAGLTLWRLRCWVRWLRSGGYSEVSMLIEWEGTE